MDTSKDEHNPFSNYHICGSTVTARCVPTLEYHLTTVSSQTNFRHSIEFAVFRCLGVWRFNTLEPVHKITKFSVGLYKSNLVTIFVIKQINVSQWWEGNIKKNSIASVCASGYFPFNKVSSRTNVDEEWQMADAHADEGPAVVSNTALQHYS